MEVRSTRFVNGAGGIRVLEAVIATDINSIPMDS